VLVEQKSHPSREKSRREVSLDSLKAVEKRKSYEQGADAVLECPYFGSLSSWWLRAANGMNETSLEGVLTYYDSGYRHWWEFPSGHDVERACGDTPASTIIITNKSHHHYSYSRQLPILINKGNANQSRLDGDRCNELTTFSFIMS
jgi:hypothetical protein